MLFLKRYFLPVVVFCLGGLSAQTISSRITPSPAQYTESRTSVDTIKILAAMVEFQKDTDNNTTGDGTFASIYAKNYADKIIDPLPHDADYFGNHLEFAKNYFAKVSNGKAIVVYQILPGLLTVSKTMRNYSPAINSTDFSATADFIKEVWTLASAQNPNFNFGDYNLFAIFHAGVGRDISLPGSLGNEKDLPSVYLGLKTLQKYYGSSFDGFQVGNSNFKITNSMILPQTENREVTNFGQTSLFQISINGLIAANVASFLGLPDLFDTKTGLSAIGKFGLMDGQAIFANRGLFPPEPSAWEKIYLGWETAIEVPVVAGNTSYSIVPSLVASHKLLKVPINSHEYYLVEYRQRDYHQDGLKISLKKNNANVTQSFALNAYSYFEAIPDTLLAGVTTDVDEFDVSLPASGILIWHIDEKIISEKIADNKINADKTHRGVDLEEADGVQDIGEVFTTVFGDQVVGEGTKNDLWFSSNPAKLFHNKFSIDTRPSSIANDGANSLITFQNFSDSTNPTEMTFDLQFGGEVVKPIFRKAITLPSTDNKLTSVNFYGKKYFFVVANAKLYQFDERGILVDSVDNFSSFKPTEINNYLVGLFNPVDPSLPSVVNVLNYNVTPKKLVSKNYERRFSAPPFISAAGERFADSSGRGLRIEIFSDPITIVSDSIADTPVSKFAGLYGNYAISGNSFFYDFSLAPKTFSEKLLSLATTGTFNDKEFSIILSESKFYVANEKHQIFSEFPVEGSPKTFSLANIKQDGSNYILYTNGNNLEAYNLSGAAAENFPFRDPMGIGFVGTPLAANIQGDGNAEIITATLDGRIFAIDGGTGKVVSGFPISTGQSLTSTPILFSDSGKVSLAVLNKNSFSAFNISDGNGPLYWTEENGDSWNRSFAGGVLNQKPSAEFFPKTKAYNWPNPVNEGQTHIRYYVSEDSKINIKIFDLAGDFVAELNNTAIGGMDNETNWNVSGIQSGIYFARVEATGTSGKSESAIIKIAVVK